MRKRWRSPTAANSDYRRASSPTRCITRGTSGETSRAGMVMINLPTAGRRLSRAVRRYAQIQLRRARARLRGGRILHADQNRLHRGLGLGGTNDSRAIYPSLRGKRVLITGGGSGHRRRNRRGIRAAGCGRELHRHLRRRITRTCGPHRRHVPQCRPQGYRGDPRRHRRACDQRGPIDVLVNNAANDDRHSSTTSAKPIGTTG